MQHPLQHQEKHGLESPGPETSSHLETPPEPTRQFEPKAPGEWLQEEAAFQRSGEWFKAAATNELPSRSAWLARSDAVRAEVDKLHAAIGDTDSHWTKKSQDWATAEVEKLQSAFKSIIDRPQNPVESPPVTADADRVEVQAAHETTLAAQMSMAKELLQRFDTDLEHIEEIQARSEKVLAAGQQTRAEIMATAPKLLQNLDADLSSGGEMLADIAASKSRLQTQVSLLQKYLQYQAKVQEDAAPSPKVLAETLATVALIQNLEAGVKTADGLETQLQQVQTERQLFRAEIMSEADHVQHLHAQFKQSHPQPVQFEEIKATYKSSADQLQALMEEIHKAVEILPNEAAQAPHSAVEPQAIPEGTIHFAVEQDKAWVTGVEDAQFAAPPEQEPVLVSCERFHLQPVAGPDDAMLIGVQTLDTAAGPV